MAKRKKTGPTLIQRSRSKGAEEKALYHNVTGAGKSKVTRKFLGLTEQEQEQIRQRVIAGMDRELKRRGA